MSDPNVPPAGGGAQPPQQPPPGGGGQPPDIGTALSYAWNKYTQNLGPFILLTIGVWVATAVAGAIAFFLIWPFVNDSAGWVGLVLASAVSAFLVFVVLFATSAGLYRAGLGVTQGRTPAFSMFTEGTNFVPFVLTVVVVGLAVAIGIVLCYIPGLIVAFFTIFAPLRALDKGEGPGDAIRGSIDMVRENIGPVVLLYLAIVVLNFVGGLCFIALLVTIPVALVTTCWYYRNLTGEPIAP